MKILLDILGGDKAPAEPLLAAHRALSEDKELELVLAGKKEEIEEFFKDKPEEFARVEILEAKEAVLNTDHPATFLKQKPESSLAVAFSAMRHRDDIDALISAGPTGALLTGAVLSLGRIAGVKRPALMTTLPGGGKILDSGANMDCKPEYLVQFAQMADVYFQAINDKKPRIGLLSVGKEEGKGNELTKETYALLKEEKSLNFVGNVEGDTAFEDVCDVVVADGFAGNVFIKAAEGGALYATGLFKKAMKRNIFAKLGALLQMKGLKEAKAEFSKVVDACAPLLGCRKLVLKCHGKANALPLYNSICEAKRLTEMRMIERIAEAVKIPENHTNSPAE